jgi:hypothetical protein
LTLRSGDDPINVATQGVDTNVKAIAEPAICDEALLTVVPAPVLGDEGLALEQLDSIVEADATQNQP